MTARWKGEGKSTIKASRKERSLRSWKERKQVLPQVGGSQLILHQRWQKLLTHWLPATYKESWWHQGARIRQPRRVCHRWQRLSPKNTKFFLCDIHHEVAHGEQKFSSYWGKSTGMGQWVWHRRWEPHKMCQGGLFWRTWLAWSVEHASLDLGAMSLSPMSGAEITLNLKK